MFIRELYLSNIILRIKEFKCFGGITGLYIEDIVL